MTASTDLSHLIATPGEGARRQIKGAAGGTLAPKLERKSSGASRRQSTLLRKVLKVHAAGDTQHAAELAIDALELDPGRADANHIMALMLYHLGHLSRAIDFFERALAADPADAAVYSNIGMTAWKLDSLDTAEKFYSMALHHAPGDREATINLAGVLRDQGRFDAAIEILRTAIYAAERDHELWNALGAVLLEAGDPVQAQTFYAQSLEIKPDYARGWHNLAYAKSMAGDVDGAITAYDKAKINPLSPTDLAQTRHGRALALLAARRLEEGWAELNVRLDPHYATGTIFRLDTPMWDGAGDIAGKTLLFLGEQGLGDEVLYAGLAPELIEDLGPDGHIIIACEPRLIPLFRRSFPDAVVGAHRTISREGREIRGVLWLDGVARQPDVWTPMANLCARYRPDVASFERTARGYLKPDPDRVAAFRAELDALGTQPKVGLCWKSKLMTASRSKYFSPFTQWEPILRTPGVQFVSMQYGDVDAELAEAARDFGVNIHQLDGLDLTDDLDGVAAAGAALDLTIGPMNASTNLAAAAGGLIWVVALKSHWPLFTSDKLVWYPEARAFSPDAMGDWRGAMTRVATALADFAGERQAA